MHSITLSTTHSLGPSISQSLCLSPGETDGSSFPNGGLRATHTAGAYLSVDPTSPIFLRGDTIFIPAAFVAFTGHALDEKVGRRGGGLGYLSCLETLYNP